MSAQWRADKSDVVIGVGSWMIYYGFMLRPAVSAVAVLTLLIGAAVYYARLRGDPSRRGGGPTAAAEQPSVPAAQ